MNATATATIADKPAQIARFALISLRGRMRLEVAGMRVSRGPSAYSILKKMGYKGTKQEVLDALHAEIVATR